MDYLDVKFRDAQWVSEMNPDDSACVWCCICGLVLKRPPPDCEDFEVFKDVCPDCRRAWDY